MFSRSIHATTLLALFAGACGSTSSTPAEMDAAVIVDALALDSGVPDAGAPEVGTPDASAPDVLWPDYGSVADAAAPSFSSLPPFDKIGTKWAYAYVEAGAKKTYKVEVTGKVLQAGGGYGYVHQQTFASPLVSSLHLFVIGGASSPWCSPSRGPAR